MIVQYEKNVFTHKGQGNVEAFGNEVLVPGLPNELKAVKPLKVYAGYHGDNDGKFLKAFNDKELKKARAIASWFPNANLVEKTTELTDNEIKKDVEYGNVLFTWCDSDKRVNNVVDKDMPKHKKDW